MQLANDCHDTTETAIVAVLNRANPVGVIQMNECQAGRRCPWRWFKRSRACGQDACRSGDDETASFHGSS
jgi:hypothetical protein